MDNISNSSMSNTMYNEYKIDVYNPCIIYQRLSDRVLQNFEHECNECRINNTLKDKFQDIVENARYQLSVNNNWYFISASKEQKEQINKLEQEAQRKLYDSVRSIVKKYC